LIYLLNFSKLYEDFGNDLSKINDAKTWSLPLPATYAINQNKRILKAFVNTDYRQRMDPREALEAITETNII
jgi:peroxiredoxin